jgi:Leucine-rich repeat (LRR) protein
MLSAVREGTADKLCKWNEEDRDIDELEVSYCESPRIDSIFLGRTSKDSTLYLELTTLKIKTSLIEIEKERFTRAKNLENLDLSENKIQHIHEKAFNGLEKLESLDFDENNLHSLPMKVFAELSNLKYLTLNNNQLILFDFAIVERNSNLNLLAISGNAITHVMTSKPFISNLQGISMERNSLIYLSLEMLPQFPVLGILHINENALTQFDFESVPAKLPKLEEFHFGVNPFDCC